jgi:hypothetical protein
VSLRFRAPLLDYTAEDDGFFLEEREFTLDRANEAYCALSPRADEELFIVCEEILLYPPVIFGSLSYR